MVMTQTHHVYVHKESDLSTLILLDSGSIIDLFSNKGLLRNIHLSNNSCRIQGNGGMVTTKLQNTLHGYGEVWYCKQALTNVLSLSNLKSKFQVQYNSKYEDSFFASTPGGVQKFKSTCNGLDVLDIGDKD